MLFKDYMINLIWTSISMDPSLVFYECDQCHLKKEGVAAEALLNQLPSANENAWFSQIDQSEADEYLGSSILIGWRQVVVVGGQHSPINHSTSCLQIRGGRLAGDKVISLICSFIHFSHCAPPQTSYKLIWKLEQWIPKWSAGSFSNVKIWESAKSHWIPMPKTCSKLILIDVSPRQRSEKARELVECRRVR